MSERRFGDQEMREIFSLAVTGGAGRDQAQLPAEADGLTLEELQRIGQEAGIDPSRVAQAAATLDARGRAAPVQKSFGLPIGVSRVVDLPRGITDREWEHLITEFRTIFGSQGVATSSGSFREWSVGELHISVEPTARGQQLRLRTRKTDADALNALTVIMSAFALITSVAVTAAGKIEKAVPVVIMFGGIAVVAFAANLVRLPSWARTRQRQMEMIAEHVVKLLSRPETT